MKEHRANKRNTKKPPQLRSGFLGTDNALYVETCAVPSEEVSTHTALYIIRCI